MSQPALAQTINETSEKQVEQFREFSKIYNTMSELCFNQCVWDFGTTQIRNREERCALNCTENYMKATKLMGESFAPTAMVSGGLGSEDQ